MEIRGPGTIANRVILIALIEEVGLPIFIFEDMRMTYLFYQGNEDFGRTWFLSQRKIIWRDGFPQLK